VVKTRGEGVKKT